MPIRAAIFDLGQTLVGFDFSRIQPAFAHRLAAARELMALAETGRILPADFQARACELTGVAPADFDAWWNSIFLPGWLVPPDWIAGLRRRLRVGVLSNTNALHFDYLRRQYPELAGFDFHILSHEVGAAKPDAHIYAAAEAAAGCAPQEIFYTDDLPEFVAAARARGWQAEPFTGAATLGRHLAALGLLPHQPRPAAASRTN